MSEHGRVGWEKHLVRLRHLHTAIGPVNSGPSNGTTRP
jgi:hypothetical protein